jgi:hypothetical protein
MKKNLALFITLIALSGNAFGDSWTDTVTGRKSDCDGSAGWWNWWWSSAPSAPIGAVLYDNGPNIRKCTETKNGHWDWFWWHWTGYDRSWKQEVNTCVPSDHDKYNDSIMTWVPSPYELEKCWSFRCKTKFRYFAGDMNSGTVDYTACNICEMPVVDIVTSDPTEISYLKIQRVIGSENDCPAGSAYNENCKGFHSNGRDAVGNNILDSSCIKQNCRCTGNAVEYKNGDDYMAKCG